MKTYIVQLDSHDDVISARDKISWSKAPRVLLVWPRQGRVLERRVDLLLLQRHSQQLGVQMAVVTRREPVRQNARALGIPIFNKAVQAQQSTWRRPNPRRRTFRPEGAAPPDPAALRQARQNLAGAQSILPDRLRLSVFLVGLAAFLALAFFFMPGAEIELTPIRQTRALSIAAWASPQVGQANPSGAVPAFALSVTVEGRDTAQSSGMALVDDQLAAGTVQFTNLTDQPVRVPAGTAVQTLDARPVRFLTTRAVDLPAGPGQIAPAAVRAEVPGPQGNVGPGTIRAVEGLVGLRVSVDNETALSGGSRRRSAAPSDQDYRALREKLQRQLEITAEEELRARLLPEQRLLPATIRAVEVASEEREPAVGQPADQLQLTLRMTVEGWYVLESDLSAVAQAALDANPEPGFQPLEGSLRVQFASEPVMDENGAVRWSMHGERTLEAVWSPEQAVRSIRGQRLEDAARNLQAAFPLAGPPRITIFPEWWNRMPYLPFRITLVQK